MFSKKRKYFLWKLDGVQKMIWDNEFKREKALMIREEVRREYDGTCSRLDIIGNKIKSQLKTLGKICEVHYPEKGKERIHKDKGNCTCDYIEKHEPKSEIETWYDERERLTISKDKLMSQMKKIDLDVQGSRPTSEFPEGMEGINDVLESLRELQIMYREYLKKI